MDVVYLIFETRTKVTYIENSVFVILIQGVNDFWMLSLNDV